VTTHQEFAPAKVNLSLAVVGRREDGYHLLESLVAFADIGDDLDIEIEEVPERANECESVSIAGPFAAALHEALGQGAALSVERAYEIARAAARPRRFSVDVALIKSLPVAAGLGGGTSDAAAALRVLARAFELPWTDDEMARQAIALGADGPACVLARPLVMCGIGEDLRPLRTWPALDVVLANSGCAAPTPDVFAAFAAEGRYSEPGLAPPSASTSEEAIAVLRTLGNDLTDAATKVAPPIKETLAALTASPGARLARMSGSGATCWAVFDDAGAANRAAAQLGDEHPDWWAAPARLGGAGTFASSLGAQSAAGSA
jgi:4-diphosphocytidyl-2-C-methyl-D-erythritol kinase